METEEKVLNTENDTRDNIDYDKLAQAIVKAKILYDEEIQKRESELAEERRKERDRVRGLKDYSNEKSWFVRTTKQFINYVVMFFRLLFMKKSDAKYFSYARGLFQMLTALMFLALRIVLYIVTIIVFVRAFTHGQILENVTCGIAAFIFAQLFRLAQFEISRMEDDGYVLALFATLISVASIVLAIVLR